MTKKSFFFFFLVFFTITLSFTFSMARKTGTLVGRWKPIEDIKDPHVQELGKFAVSEHNKEAKSNLSFDEVVRGDTQVVSGLKYRLVVTAKDGSLKKNEYEAVVWEKAWLGFKNLTSFKQL